MGIDAPERDNDVENENNDLKSENNDLANENIDLPEATLEPRYHVNDVCGVVNELADVLKRGIPPRFCKKWTD